MKRTAMGAMAVLVTAAGLAVFCAPVQAAPPTPPDCWVVSPLNCIGSTPTPPGRR